MDNDTTYTLVESSNRGRYALDAVNGPDITCGQPLAIWLGGQWIAGRVEHSGYPTAKYPEMDGCYSLTGAGLNIGYFFIAQDGSICGLCVGMKVRLD